MTEAAGSIAVRSVTTCTSAKRYAEVKLDVLTAPDTTMCVFFGVTPSGVDPTPPGTGTGIGIKNRPGFLPPRTEIWANSALISGGGPALATGDVLNIALDSATGNVWLGINGTYYYTSGTMTAGGDPGAGTNKTGTISFSLPAYIGFGAIAGLGVHFIGVKTSLRTQASQFTGSIPSGFSAWYP